MAKQVQVEVLHYPTLKTIMAIEDTVKAAEEPISRSQILVKLENRVMRPTLNVALDYLEKRGMVLETKSGFIWTFNPSKRLAAAEKDGLVV